MVLPFAGAIRLGDTNRVYLSYDIRGIQKFIFAVPNLRCIIGASSQIARFDQFVGQEFQSETIYAGGGSGMLRLDESQVAEVEKSLLQQASQIGADLRIGKGESFSEAKTNDQLFPFIPDSLEGLPCSMSGLLPVNPDRGWDADPNVHPLIGERRRASQADALNSALIDDVREIVEQRIAGGLEGFDLRFFRNVSIRGTEKNSRDGWDADNLERAVAGSAALGNRNRWAVIAMDGNDAGRQHQTAEQWLRDKNKKWTTVDREQWLQSMSRHLADATRESFCHAAAEVIIRWLDGTRPTEQAAFVHAGSNGPVIVLPIRPLVIGGDDVILLCHTDFAMTFVKSMSQQFSLLCNTAADEYQQQTGHPLWPASGNQLTISAGVLFVKDSYPLQSAIQYAENLLGSAKGAFRQPSGVDAPMPPAVDFDVVTDSLLDTPAARRKRELTFFDEDIGQTVQLTRRPYCLQSIEDQAALPELEELVRFTNRLPRGLVASLLNHMTQPWTRRVEFLASHSHKQPELYRMFNEENVSSPGDGWHVTKSTDSSPDIRKTSLVDALLLHEESRRQEQMTTGADDLIGSTGTQR